MEKKHNFSKGIEKSKLIAARRDVDRHPTEKQCKAGNYKMGHVRIMGFDISIENPKGSYRCGKDRNGKEWRILMNNDYGYFVRTVGKDGDAIDVFIGPNLKSRKIYAIDQNVNGKFDETKVMLGFNDAKSAKKAYLSNYERGWKGFSHISGVSVETFRKWLYDGYRQRKPFYQYVEIQKMLIKEKENNEKIGMFISEGIRKRDLVNTLIESKSVRSKRVQEILRQHGGLHKDSWQRGRHSTNYISTDLHNMRGDDVIAVLTADQVRDIQQGHDLDQWRWADNNGLDLWAKDKGCDLQKGDRVETLELGDGMYMVYIERNAEFKRSGRSGGYQKYYSKREGRRYGRYADGAERYQPMSNKAMAARDLRTNPYFWEAKRGTLHDKDSGWNNPEKRKQAMDYARQGKDPWGYDALDHYKH